MSYEKNDLGQRYAAYHQQLGNLYATSHLLAAEEASAMLYPVRRAVRRAIAWAQGRVVERVFRPRLGATVSRSQTVAE
jgi:hypothetical protein